MKKLLTLSLALAFLSFGVIACSSSSYYSDPHGSSKYDHQTKKAAHSTSQAQKANKSPYDGMAGIEKSFNDMDVLIQKMEADFDNLDSYMGPLKKRVMEMKHSVEMVRSEAKKAKDIQMLDNVRDLDVQIKNVERGIVQTKKDPDSGFITIKRGAQDIYMAMDRMNALIKNRML